MPCHVAPDMGMHLIYTQLGDLGIAKLAKTEGVAAKTQIGEALMQAISIAAACYHFRNHMGPSYCSIDQVHNTI